MASDPFSIYIKAEKADLVLHGEAAPTGTQENIYTGMTTEIGGNIEEK